ncbi:hypothetical protein RND71_031263 [Anisodus tanguticus]|uniref:F-box protein n=1 Tax=Anisodus tanguticus TaxID=243964 RepID=A0AAE1RBH0_9SOLA|nr:hypothetical protein RND71_031263 [Anisodus tanguticus]
MVQAVETASDEMQVGDFPKAYGFGYVDAEDDYKILGIFKDYKTLQFQEWGNMGLPESTIPVLSNPFLEEISWLQVLDGKLSLLIDYVGIMQHADIWIMTEYAVKGSWKEMFNIYL